MFRIVKIDTALCGFNTTTNRQVVFTTDNKELATQKFKEYQEFVKPMNGWSEVILQEEKLIPTWVKIDF